MYSRLIMIIACVAMLASCKTKKEDPAAEQKQIAEQVYRENLKKLDSLKALVHDGDLVTRCSNAWDSEQIRVLQQKDKSYTHAGIAKIENGRISIYHIMTEDSIYKTDYTLLENIDSFLNPKVYTAFGVFRFDLDSTQKTEVMNYIDDCYKRKVRFDKVFDNRNDSVLYCTEMIAKGITKATNGTIKFTTTSVTDRAHINQIKRYFRKYHLTEKDIINRPVYLIDDLTTNPACKTIRRFSLLQ